jgi:hypothetical protein
MKNAPWSSSAGTRPASISDNPQMPAPNSPDHRQRPASPTRTRRRTIAAYPSRAASIPRSSQPHHAPALVDCAAGTPRTSAGDSVSALIAEMIIATLMVTANCRNSWPDNPGMNPIGTNTDSSTSEIAMIGPVICFIAFFVASCGDQMRLLLQHPLDVLHHHDRIIHHDADRQHHGQQRDRVGGKAEHEQHRERADQAHRHRDHRDDRRPQIAKEQVDDRSPPA